MLSTQAVLGCAMHRNASFRLYKHSWNILSHYVRFHDQVSLACDNGGSAYSSTVLLSSCLGRDEKAAG